MRNLNVATEALRLFLCRFRPQKSVSRSNTPDRTPRDRLLATRYGYCTASPIRYVEHEPLRAGANVLSGLKRQNVAQFRFLFRATRASVNDFPVIEHDDAVGHLCQHAEVLLYDDESCAVPDAFMD